MRPYVSQLNQLSGIFWEHESSNECLFQEPSFVYFEKCVLVTTSNVCNPDENSCVLTRPCFMALAYAESYEILIYIVSVYEAGGSQSSLS